MFATRFSPAEIAVLADCATPAPVPFRRLCRALLGPLLRWNVLGTQFTRERHTGPVFPGITFVCLNHHFFRLEKLEPDATLSAVGPGDSGECDRREQQQQDRQTAPL